MHLCVDSTLQIRYSSEVPAENRTECLHRHVIG